MIRVLHRRCIISRIARRSTYRRCNNQGRSIIFYNILANSQTSVNSICSPRHASECAGVGSNSLLSAKFSGCLGYKHPNNVFSYRLSLGYSPDMGEMRPRRHTTSATHQTTDYENSDSDSNTSDSQKDNSETLLCVDDELLEEQFVRGSGKGGQKINKVSKCNSYCNDSCTNNYLCLGRRIVALY